MPKTGHASRTFIHRRCVVRLLRSQQHVGGHAHVARKHGTELVAPRHVPLTVDTERRQARRAAQQRVGGALGRLHLALVYGVVSWSEDCQANVLRWQWLSLNSR